MGECGSECVCVCVWLRKENEIHKRHSQPKERREVGENE